MPYKITYIFILTAFVYSVAHAVPEIKFTAKEGAVITPAERATVLSVSDLHLGTKDGSFLTQLESVEAPFTPRKVDAPVVAEVVEGQVVADAPVVEEIIYDDATVLKMIVENFSKQVRGTLSRGTNNYIQLEGGGMLKQGATFPAHISEAKDREYTVQLIEVTSDQYTLSLGDAVLTRAYSDYSDNVKKTP